MKYIKAFFNTTIGACLGVYLFGCVIMYLLSFPLSFLGEDSFSEYLYTGYLNLNLFFRQVINAIAGFASLAILGISWIIITEIKDHFMKQFKEELEEIENKENKK